MTDQENPAVQGNSTKGEPAPDLNVDAMIRDYDKKYRVPRLEDILNDADLDEPAPDPKRKNTKNYEGRPTSEDFAPPYTGTDPASKAKRAAPASARKQYRRVATTDDERRWATIAHLSAVATLVAAIFSAGFLSLATIFIPLGIYFYWRKRSEYVAFQALQAFTLQVLGTVGWLALLTVGSLVFGLLVVVLLLTIVGSLLLIVLVPAFVLLVLASFALPIGMVIYSVIAAIQTNQGVDYRLPRVGRWIDNQMHNSFIVF